METYKRRFNFKDHYRIMAHGMVAFPRLALNFIVKTVDHKFIERLMLATTEVNGCAACSYYHARMALKGGFSQNEIDSFLAGDPAYIMPEEATGILFAQHYAETTGIPDEHAYTTLRNTYGDKKARILVSAIQVMMMGNALGIPLSALWSRLRGKPYQNSTFLYELTMNFLGVILFPIVLINALFFWIFRLPNIRFGIKTVETKQD